MAKVDKLSGSMQVVKARGFVRDKSLDFSDDGNRFQGYMWEGKVPLTQCCSGGETYLTVRDDYLRSQEGIPYEFWKQYKSSNIGDEYNGTSEKIDLDNLVIICKSIYEDIQKAKKDFEAFPVTADNSIARLEAEIKVSEETLKRNLNWFEMNLSASGIKEAYDKYNTLKKTLNGDYELLGKLKSGKVEKSTLYNMNQSSPDYYIGRSNYYVKYLNELIDQKDHSWYYIERKDSMR